MLNFQSHKFGLHCKLRPLSNIVAPLKLPAFQLLRKTELNKKIKGVEKAKYESLQKVPSIYSFIFSNLRG